jgi:hypothetical protein
MLATSPLAVMAQDASPKPLKVSPVVYRIKFHNFTDHCAWVTPYYAFLYTPYEITRYGPRAVRAHEDTLIEGVTANVLSFMMPLEIKVRAEIKRNGCSGENLSDISAENKINVPSLFQVYVTTEINGQNPYFHISQPR